jgi:hypothetical protein
MRLVASSRRADAGMGVARPAGGLLGCSDGSIACAGVVMRT